MRAARSPSQGSGNRNPNIASDGIVCSTFATAITGFAHRGARLSQTPAGTAIAVANNIAAPVSHICSSVNVAISPPYCVRKPALIPDSPELLLRNPLSLRRDDRPERSLGLPVAATASIRPAPDLPSTCLDRSGRCDRRDTVPHRGRGSPTARSSSSDKAGYGAYPASRLSSADQARQTAHP